MHMVLYSTRPLRACRIREGAVVAATGEARLTLDVAERFVDGVFASGRQTEKLALCIKCL